MKSVLNNAKYKLFTKILIANRGEIALRVIRACHELEISTVAIYSTTEKDSLHVKLADESICIGPGPIIGSYANHNSILQAAISTGCQAIHPGYGFLSENAQFAQAVIDAGLIWIGPQPQTIALMGNKVSALEFAQKTGVPVAGSSRDLLTAKNVKKMATKIGYPVIIKAAGGGGGRAMEIVSQGQDIKKIFHKITKEAMTLYQNGQVYLEKYIEQARHIEIQILGDHFGNIVHLFDRDCTLQRRNQKLIEEAPSAFLTAKTRKQMTTAALALAQGCHYQSAGTVEFLVDQRQNFYFMEMNTRIQVEHPVTEMITGVNIVKEQLKIAAGKKITWQQSDLKMDGHAIEIRLNAEDATNDFFPSTGQVSFLHFPGGKGIRIDSGLYNGYHIPVFYDSMIGKLIVHSFSRDHAILKAKRALEELVIEGIKTNIHFQYHLLLSSPFINNDHDTSYVEKRFCQKYLSFKRE